jgi:hypothetical protein
VLTYRDVDHSYAWNGFPIPSLSDMLQLTGWGTDYSGIPAMKLELAAIRGTQAHAAIDRYLAGDPSYAEELSEASEPYFESFLKVEHLLPLTREGVSELPVGGWCGYGTTPDRVEQGTIIEWKCTSRLYPSVYIQMAGQEYALADGPNERIAVHLLKTGKAAKLHVDPDPVRTLRLWENSLDGYRWKQENKWK